MQLCRRHRIHFSFTFVWFDCHCPWTCPALFCGATAGVYGNATGGVRGAVAGAFVNGLLLSFLPACLLPVLGALGFEGTTFGDTDFGIIGILIGLIKFLFQL